MSTPIIILAGGKSSRMGRDKTRLDFRGETLLDRALRRFSEHFPDVYVSVAAIPPSPVGRDIGGRQTPASLREAPPFIKGAAAAETRVPISARTPPPFEKGVPPLGGGGLSSPAAPLLPDLLPNLGPLSGLHAALSRFDSAFLVAADMPLAEPELAAQIIAAASGFDACAATSNGHTEPTFAYYSRAVLPELLAAIDRGDYSLHRLLERVNANYVEIPAETLLNINYPDDYEKLLSGD